MLVIKAVLILVVLIFGVLFYHNNSQLVSLDYYIGILELPFSLFIISFILIGTILAIIVIFPKIFFLKYQISKLQKQVKRLEYQPDEQ